MQNIKFRPSEATKKYGYQIQVKKKCVVGVGSLVQTTVNAIVTSIVSYNDYQTFIKKICR
jgi:hypothetical protein